MRFDLVFLKKKIQDRKENNMKHIKIRHMVAAIIFLILVLLSSADGKNRPTGPYSGPDSCWVDHDTEASCSGLICYCCYDDGCWICNNVVGDTTDCVWDPKYSSRNLPSTEPPTISPGSGKVPLKPINGTLLQTEPISISPGSRQTPIKTASVTAQAGPTIINFDDLVTGGLGTGGPISVINQYASQGITFNGPVAIDFSKGTAIPGFAHSGTNAIEQCYSQEFCTAPIDIRFSQGQARVKVWVGYDKINNEKTPIILRAFDSSGKQIAKDSENLMEGGPTPIQIPLEVSTINQKSPLLTRNKIVRVTVDFADENRYTNGLAIDDVEFQRLEGILPENEPQLVKDSLSESGNTNTNNSILTTGNLKVNMKRG